MEKGKKAVSTVGFIFAATLLSKVFGQLREIFIGSAYGTGALASAYFAASQIPASFFDMILGSAVSSAFIPVFNSYLRKDGRDRAEKFASLFFNIVILITLVFTVLGILGSHAITGVFVPGMSSENKAVTAHLLRIMFPMVIFIAAAFTVVGVLQSYGSFKVPAVMSIVSSVVCIMYLVTLNNRFGINGLAFSLLLGWALQFIVLLPSLFRSGFRYRPVLDFKDEGIRQVASIAIPVLFSTWVQPINVTVNMMVASGLESGQAVAAINYANRLYLIVAGVFAVSVTNYVFPEMSRLGAGGNAGEWLRVVSGSVRAVAAAILPVMAMFLVLAEPIIRLVYQRSQFGEDSVRLTSTALFFYSMGMLGFALQEVLNKAFFSLKDSKTPMYISVGGMALNVLLSMTLPRFMGLGGLALASSVSASLCAAVSIALLFKDTWHNDSRDLLIFAAKVLIMAILAGLAAYGAKAALSPVLSSTFYGRCALVAAAGMCGAAVYALAAFALRLEEARTVLHVFRRP